MEEKKSQKTSKKTETALTLINAFSTIEEKMSYNGLYTKNLRKVKKELDYIKTMFNLNDCQIVILSILLANDGYTSMQSLGQCLGLRGVQALTISPDISELVKMRIIQSQYDDVIERVCYSVKKYVVNTIMKNQKFIPEKLDGLSGLQLIKKFVEILNMKCDKALSYDELIEELQLVYKLNENQTLCRVINNYNLNPNSLICITALMARWIICDCHTLSRHNIEKYYKNPFDLKRFWNTLIKGDNELIKRGILEPACEDGIADITSFCFTREAVSTILPDFEQDLSYPDNDNDELIKSSSINAKNMFFNESNRAQINELSNLLQNDKFADIQQRLKSVGLRTGFACMFYGGPGTGKTELVMQLARETGRDIMQIDISSVKEKWYGQSERNIKALFDKYRSLVRTRKVTPILFFNEADGVFGKRLEDVQHSTEKSENAIQNIILQEMENLDGILIATTNLAGNLDSAMERRFLYKIQFEKPDADTRSKIWQSMLPSISQEEASMLASRYEFSGGQIENIARKSLVNHVLYNTQASFETLDSYCRDETYTKSDSRPFAGFHI